MSRGLRGLLEFAVELFVEIAGSADGALATVALVVGLLTVAGWFRSRFKGVTDDD